MKTKISSKILLSLGLAFVLVSAITQVNGGIEANSEAERLQLPLVAIHSTGDVYRGNIGSFVLGMQAPTSTPIMLSGTYVNFKVSGTAIPGVDYVVLVSPSYIGQSSYGTILVKTLPDPRASPLRQAYSVVITLEAGPGYAVGAPSSATMWIKPLSVGIR